MATAGVDPDEPRVYTEAAKEWQRNRAATQRRKDITIESRMDYSPIVWPNVDKVRHAALVVCAAMADEDDPVAAAREILEALAIPTVLAAGGGDGRVLRIQKTPLKSDIEPKPLGFGENDYGRPAPKQVRTRTSGRRPRNAEM